MTDLLAILMFILALIGISASILGKNFFYMVPKYTA